MPASQTIDKAADKADSALKSADSSFNDIAKRAERAIHEGFESLRNQTRVYADTAGEQIDTAQRYVTQRVQERPLAATAAALGVGVLVGFLLASGRRR